MPSEDKDEKRDSLNVFKGDKNQYEDWLLVFEAWEDSKEIRAATSVDRVNDMPTIQEGWAGTKAGTDATGNAVQVPLTDEEKKLRKDNDASRGKMMRYVDQTLRQPMDTAGGPKKSVWLMKQWLKQNFGVVTAADSLQELNEKKTKLHPGDYKECMFYLSKLEDLNNKLGAIESTGKYKLDELELKTEVLAKIPDGGNWASFKAEYRKKDSLSGTSWADFKDHLTREWLSQKSPSGGTSTGKALTIQVPGSAYFPYDCGWCGVKGHKLANCPEKKAGKPKVAKSGWNEKKHAKNGSAAKSKGPKNGGVCFNCNKTGHFARDCKEPKKEKTDQAREVVLMAKTAVTWCKPCATATQAVDKSVECVTRESDNATIDKQLKSLIRCTMRQGWSPLE